MTDHPHPEPSAGEPSGIGNFMVSEQGRVIADLAMVLKRICYAINKRQDVHDSLTDYAQTAMQYLVGKGLQGSPFRGEAAPPRAGDPSPETAPCHTDLMVPPESIDAFLEANPLPGEEAREQIARLVDPSSWSYWDGYHERHGKAHSDNVIAPSLALADQILALTSPPTPTVIEDGKP